MELPNVGNRCSIEGCGRLDFLPVVCDYCHQPFCSEHGSVFAHACPDAPQARAAQHACADEQPVTFYTRPSREPPKHAYNESKKVLSTEQLKALEMLKLSNNKSAQLSSKSKPKVNQHPKVSPKIALMRLKAKATGNTSIDMADRLYLCVMWLDKSLAVFINKNSGIGNAATRFSTMLHLSQLPDKVYRLRIQGADEPLPSNKSFDEQLAADNSSGLFNGCTLELFCK